MIMLVHQGFSLRDLRNLYSDEFFEYYKENIYVLEKSGKLKEGAYDKYISKGEDVVASLRRQLKGIKISNK